MKSTITKSFFLAYILLLSLLPVRIVFAHGDDARIEINPERLNPGVVLEVRGVAFEPETEVTIKLVNSQVDLVLGVMTTNMEGIFQLTTALPVDLAEGTYVVRVKTSDEHTIDSPAITVWGTASMEGGGQGPRDEDDGLLAPMPTYAPAEATPLPQSAPPIESGDAPETPAPTIFYGWIFAGIGIVLMLVIFTRFRK